MHCSGIAPAAATALGVVVLSSFAPGQESLEQRVDALEKEVKELRAQAVEPAGATELSVFWRDGLRLESADQSVKMRLGGCAQFDAIAGSSDPEMSAAGKDIEDGAEIRRARIYVNGSLGDLFAFRAMYDFADSNKVRVSDLWGEVRQIPVVGKFRVGQFWEPVSFETWALDVETDFKERSLMNALSPNRNIGAALHDDCGGRLAWWFGAFVDDGSGDPGIAQGDGDHALTARVTGLPCDTADDESFLHLGVSASFRTPTDGEVIYATRPESHLAPVFATTGTLTDVKTVVLLGGEIAGQWGPWHAAAEWLESKLDADAEGDPSFPGWYLSAGWFITGEHQGYVHSDGGIKSPRILSPYGVNGGFGAFELVARVSQLDLDSGNVRGGKVTDTIVGLNWYLNERFRFDLDAVHSRLHGVGDSNFLEFWFQVWI